MKKHNPKKSSKGKRFFNKLGMTYVELICALSLLSLIVVMFTPMLLSSYDLLYKAGERVEGVYDSKEEIEEGLSTRYSEKTVVFNSFKMGFNNLQTNADLLFEALNVNGKKVVSSIQQGLETVFGNARASVDIVSPRTVYDDKSNHDVMIQTTGIEYSQVYFGSYTAKYGTDQTSADAKFLEEHKKVIAAGGKGIIFIEVIIPDKSQSVSSGATKEDAVYLSKNVAKLKIYEVENGTQGRSAATSGTFDMLNTDNSGRIKFNISGREGDPLDFTQSPIKIRVYYVTPRNQVKDVSDYLEIEPPTMIFAGDTDSTVDYYTSAGVTNNEGTYSFELEAREMRTANSGYLTSSDTPGSKGVRIQTVTWVQDDENAQLKPYYVMAGTNSSVYRMYNYRVKTSINEVFGISGATDTNEGSFILTDGSMANPSFWSGEMSDQYYFKTKEEGMGYGATSDNKKDCSSGTRYDYFDKNLRYVMMFNGYNTGYYYTHQSNRRISYILTEAGNKSFRLAGKKSAKSDYAGYTAVWEKTGDYLHFSHDGSELNTDDPRPVYLHTYSSVFVNSTEAHYDRNLAYLRIKSSVSVDPIASTMANDSNYKDRFRKGDFWVYRGDDSELSETTPNEYDWLSSNDANNVSISSSVYLPGAGSNGQGQVIYFGTVPAYALVRQCSDIGTTDKATKVYNNGKVKASRATGYVIRGGVDSATEIYRAYSSTGNNNADVSEKFRLLCLKYAGDADGINANVGLNATHDSEYWSNNRSEFYTYSGDDVISYTDSDLRFTFGYCSRWRMTVGDVTHDGETEETRSYEKYYKYSNPLADGDRLPASGLNTGDENNLYYDVWFPGEYYNLTQVAALDEVTVAVGYAVSGSSFMKESAVVGNGYYGTALGSVYNDGVIAAYVSEDAGGKVFSSGLSGKGEQNAIFQNVLYYKMPTFTDRTLHSRESVRFTAVDLYAVTESPIQVGNELSSSKKYYAVYGDNNGKAYYSLIATSTVMGTTQEETSKESSVTLKTGSSALQASDMIEIKVTVGVNQVSLSTIYSEITNIDASEDVIVISGKAKDSDTVEQLVVGVKEEGTSSYTFKYVKNGKFKGNINEALILGDYYYIAGDGWVAAVSLDTLKSLPNGGTIGNRSETNTGISGTSTNKDDLLWVETKTNIYALDGRLTQG